MCFLVYYSPQLVTSLFSERQAVEDDYAITKCKGYAQIYTSGVKGGGVVTFDLEMTPSCWMLALR